MLGCAVYLVGAVGGQGACTMYTLNTVDRRWGRWEGVQGGWGGGYMLGPRPPSGFTRLYINIWPDKPYLRRSNDFFLFTMNTSGLKDAQTVVIRGKYAPETIWSEKSQFRPVLQQTTCHTSSRKSLLTLLWIVWLTGSGVIGNQSLGNEMRATLKTRQSPNFSTKKTPTIADPLAWWGCQ